MYICLYKINRQFRNDLTTHRIDSNYFLFVLCVSSNLRISQRTMRQQINIISFYFFLAFNYLLFIILLFSFRAYLHYSLREFAYTPTCTRFFHKYAMHRILYYTCIFACKCCICIACIRRCTRRKATLVDYTSCIYNEMRGKIFVGLGYRVRTKVYEVKELMDRRKVEYLQR